MPVHVLGDAICHHSDEVFRRCLVFRKYHLVNKFAFYRLQNYSRQCLLEWHPCGYAFQLSEIHTALLPRLFFLKLPLNFSHELKLTLFFKCHHHQGWKKTLEILMVSERHLMMIFFSLGKDCWLCPDRRHSINVQ